jgi:arginase
MLIMNSRHFSVIGAPFNGIGVSPDQENPAQALRDAGLISLLESSGASAVDLGDIKISPFDGHRDEATHVLNQQAWKETSLILSNKLREVLDQDTTPIILGGDCGILPGIFGALVNRGKRVGLVMLDGHTDFRSPESSPSGEAADLPLWVLTGRGPNELSHLYGSEPMLQDGEIVVLGYREPDMIDQSSIIRFDRDQIAEIGVTKAARQGLRPLLDQRLELWLHFDVDVIDPLEMPAVHFPEPGGMSVSEVRDLMKEIVDTGEVLGLSVACYHNDTDPDGSSADRLVRLLSEVLT